MSTTIHRVDARDVCRVHVEPSGHPVDVELSVSGPGGSVSTERPFFVRLNNATRAIADEAERQRHIAQRWGRTAA